MLSYFGCALEKNDGRICLSPSPLHAQEVSIPGDISSAAFFMVAAAILPGSNLLLEEVGFNPSRHAVVQILQSMGANITIEDEKVLCGEPVANIRVCFSELHGITIPPHLVPIAIDEIPILMIAAACAKGETSLSHAGELRMKESDRLKAMYEGLKSIGIDVLEQEDGMRVRGGMMGGGTVDSYGDHRIAMAFSIAGLAALATIKIRDCSNVNTSFPGFVNCFSPLGLADSIREECDG
jgi:3-phosphoshikimate 1-carboxyvinyltransferase